MDRRRTAQVLLLLFVLCTGVAIVLSGSRPASLMFGTTSPRGVAAAMPRLT